MAGKDYLNEYEPTIGIECHVQLKTNSKLFARVSNDAREAQPNTTVSAICFGLPGVLPYLNQAAVDLAVKAGLALNAKINTFSKFDRKHYFYPDLPKGYQITQYDQPIIGEGYVEVPLNQQVIKVGIERAHLEEDAGKLTHPGNADYSLVDLNRAGTPLLEIVSRPDIKSPAVAKAYARELYLLMKHAGVSDVDLYHGHMRFDVNISVAKKGAKALGTRAEVKNLNSFKAVEKAAQYEFERQAELLERGEEVVQETRGWHDDKQKTFSQRSKEESHDYRYFPEPDLPPLELDDSFIKSLRSSQPMPLSERRQSLIKAGISFDVVESLFDIQIEDLGVDYLGYLDEAMVDQDRLQSSALWFVNLDAKLRREGQFKRPLIEDGVDYYAQVFKLYKSDNKLSSSNARALIERIMTSEQPVTDVEALAEEHGLIQVSDQAELEQIVHKVVTDNPKAAADYQAGESKALGFLTGQVMALSKGRANPKMVQDLLRKQLED